MADDSGAEHVRDELVVLAVPGEERGTGTAATVDLEELLALVAGDFNFVLQHSGGPEHADDVSFFRLAEADDDVGGVLAEVSVRSVNFELLAVAAREDLDLRSNGGLVVVESFERKLQPVVLGCAFVAQENRRAVVLGDKQVGGAVVVVVAGDNGARAFEMDLVEANVGGDVFESVGAEIAEEADFALAVFRFADGDQVDPAVVVVVERGDAVGQDPVSFWQLNGSERFPLIVAPEGNAR